MVIHPPQNSRCRYSLKSSIYVRFSVNSPSMPLALPHGHAVAHQLCRRDRKERFTALVNGMDQKKSLTLPRPGRTLCLKGQQAMGVMFTE